MPEMSLEEKIAADYYRAPAVSVERPREPPRKGMVTAEDLREALRLREVYEAELPAYKEACAIRERRQAVLNAEFKRDVCEELDITSHPKRDMLFDMAYQRGHSDGLRAVYSEASELVELLR